MKKISVSCNQYCSWSKHNQSERPRLEFSFWDKVADPWNHKPIDHYVLKCSKMVNGDPSRNNLNFHLYVNVWHCCDIEGCDLLCMINSVYGWGVPLCLSDGLYFCSLLHETQFSFPKKYIRWSSLSIVIILMTNLSFGVRLVSSLLCCWLLKTRLQIFNVALGNSNVAVGDNFQLALVVLQSGYGLLYMNHPLCWSWTN